MGRALAVFIWLMTILSVWMFVNGRWWFPASISEHGPAYDRQFMLTLIVVGVAFAAAQIGLGYTVWRYRDTGSGERATYSHGNNRLEVVWTSITAVIFITVAVLGQRVWAQLHFQPAPADAARVLVTAQQFQWNFHYPGPDNTFGRTDPKLISDESINYIGPRRDGRRRRGRHRHADARRPARPHGRADAHGPRRDAQLLGAAAQVQAGRRARRQDSRPLQAGQAGPLRDRVRRAVRPAALQDEGVHARAARGRVPRGGGAAGRRSSSSASPSCSRSTRKLTER